MDKELKLLGSQSSSFSVDGLSKLTSALYITGHVLNDLCAACWFNYLLYFLVNVSRVSNATAGAVMLAGQLADGIATPLVGLYSDRYETKIGKRKPWYIAGTIIVPITFFFIWQPCYPASYFDGSAELAIQILWYGTAAALFNVGWASIQISHMALLPNITPSLERRNFLIGWRTAFTYISNVAVLGMALALFNIIGSPSLQFAILSISIIAIGTGINILFILFINEPLLAEKCARSIKVSNQNIIPPADLASNADTVEIIRDVGIEDIVEIPELSWRDWMIQPKLYSVGLIYMSARLANNALTSILPFYLTTVLAMGGVDSVAAAADKTPWELALIPLSLYMGSTVASIVMDKLSARYSRKSQFIVGTIAIFMASIPMLFLTHEMGLLMIPVAIVLGIGFSLQLTNAMGFLADFVGEYGSSGAFVYGFTSFMDKVSSGVALFVITVSFI
jgi:Na+/melibiose symporter-like transporter